MMKRWAALLLLAAGAVYTEVDYALGLVRYNPDGSPDATFDGDGVAMAAFSGSADAARAMVLQSDGAIVVAGSSDSQTGAAAVRYR